MCITGPFIIVLITSMRTSRDYHHIRLEIWFCVCISNLLVLRLSSPDLRTWTRSLDCLFIMSVNRVHARSKSRNLISHCILVIYTSIQSVIVISLQYHSSWKSLSLSYLFPKRCSPTEDFPIHFTITVVKTAVHVSRFQDLHVTLKT